MLKGTAIHNSNKSIVKVEHILIKYPSTIGMNKWEYLVVDNVNINVNNESIKPQASLSGDLAF